MVRKELNIHFGYILLIAIIIIIYLLTVDFGGNDELVKYLGFGLTITSLFVGLVAITQAFFAGNSLDRTIGVLDKTTHNMLDTASDVKDIIEILQTKVDNIPKKLDDLDLKLTSTLIKTEIQKGDDAPKFKSTDVSKEEVLEFLNNSSTNGVLAIYIAALSNDTKRTFNLNSLFSESPLVPIPYTFGYIVAARSFKAFKANYNGADLGITDCKVTAKETHTILTKKINLLKNEKTTNEYQQLLRKIDDYFKV